MIISINRTLINGPYGGGNNILYMFSNYLTKLGHVVLDKINKNTNAIYIWESNPSSMSFSINNIKDYLLKNEDCLVVHRINDNGLHRNDSCKRDEWFRVANSVANKTIFISEWVREYYKNLEIDGIVIHNSADRKIFYPVDTVRNSNVPIKIVTHHWSDNINKGYDIYRKIDEFCCKNPNICHFRFIGRENCHKYFSNNCEKILPLPYKDIPPYLRSEDVYVSASLYEAGGCHLVEGMSCGLIPIVRKGGGGTECYSKNFGVVFYDSNDLIKYIIHLYNNYNVFCQMKKNIVTQYNYSSEDMCFQYYDILKSLCRKEK